MKSRAAPDAPAAGRRSSWTGFWLALLASAGILFWVAGGLRAFKADTGDVWYQKHYEYLTEGWVHGQLSLSLAPRPELLALPDPRDPRQNHRYRLWDASLYRGRYYLYFGPAPALLFMLPWRLLTGSEPPQWLTLAALATLGCAGLGLLVREIRDACFPTVSSGALALVLVVALHAAWLPVTARWSGVWQVPIVAAVASLWWTLYFVWRFRRSGRRRWAAAAGMGLVLLLASRIVFLPAAAVTLAFLGLPFPAAVARSRPFRGFLFASSLVVLGAIGLLAYNYARFGRFLEFGQSYQLWGTDERTVHHFNPAFLPFNAGLYLCSLPRLSPFFPFVLSATPAVLPPGYIDVQEVHGVLFALPVHLAALAGALWAWRRRATPDQPVAVVVGAAAVATVFAAGILFCFAGACSRYETELLAGWTVLTAVGLLALWAPGTSPGARLLRSLALVAALWSVAYTWLASAQFNNFFRLTNPVSYTRVAHALDYPSLWFARLSGRPFGPVVLRVRLGPFRRAETIPLLEANSGDDIDTLSLVRIDPTHGRLVFLENAAVTLLTPVVPLTGETLQVEAACPWLYPPKEHPYWDAFSGERRERLQSQYLIQVGDVRAAGAAASPGESRNLDPVVAWRSAEPQSSAWVESGTRSDPANLSP